jgi:hypothetical protein
LPVDDDDVVAVVDGVGNRSIGIELLALLIEIGDVEPRAVTDGPFVRFGLLHQQTQQRRFARAIRTDQADAITAQDPL